jgi:hypothetical protein
MSDPQSKFPKFPEESRRYDDARTELDRRSAEQQADVGGWADRLRHSWPAFAILGFAAVAVFLLLLTLASADVVLIVVPGPLAIGFVVLCVYLGRRHYRNGPN